jgi:hypothetical protein
MGGFKNSGKRPEPISEGFNQLVLFLPEVGLEKIGDFEWERNSYQPRKFRDSDIGITDPGLGKI